MATAPTPAKLTPANAIWYGNYANGAAYDGNKAIDGDLATAFCSDTGLVYVGIALAAAKTITAVKFICRQSDYVNRMVSRAIYGANASDFSDQVLIGTTPATPSASPAVNTVTIAMPALYRYVRFWKNDGGYMDCGEMELWGY